MVYRKRTEGFSTFQIIPERKDEYADAWVKARGNEDKKGERKAWEQKKRLKGKQTQGMTV